MTVRGRLFAVVAMLVASIWFAASPASAADHPDGQEPVSVTVPATPVLTLPLLVKDSPVETTRPAGTNDWPVVGEQLCFTQNVFDSACIRAISQDGVRWTGIRGSYAYGTGRPPGQGCAGLNVWLQTNRQGNIGAPPGSVCSGVPLVREFLNLPLSGGYCAIVVFQDQRLGYTFPTPFLCFG